MQLKKIVDETDPNEPDMKKLFRSGQVLLDDFQTMNLTAEHIGKRLHNMSNHLQTIEAMNYYLEEEDIYEGGVNKTPNRRLLQQAGQVSNGISNVQAALKNYKGRVTPVVKPKPTTKPGVSPSKPQQVGQVYISPDSRLEDEKARILTKVDSGEYDLEDALEKEQSKDDLTQRAIKELQEEQEQFGFKPQKSPASQEELDEVVDQLVREKWGR
jgi:hypothetical protein